MSAFSWPAGLDGEDADRVIQAALAEDVGTGDVTSDAVIPKNTRFSGVLAARQPMVVAGLPVAARVFALHCPDSLFTPLVADGHAVAAGTVLARIDGPAQGLLEAERTALNLLQLLSGIATLTRQYADRISGTGCTLLDTRKTIPGLRRLSKYAARMGGATNHRIGLFDAILIKDNHIAVAGGVTAAVKAALARATTERDHHPATAAIEAAAKGGARPARATPMIIEVECDTLDQVAEAAEAGAHIILLDNMPPSVLVQAVALVAGRARTEASGGVNLDTIRAIAESGVNSVSVGRITQSAPAMDIGLDWDAE